MQRETDTANNVLAEPVVLHPHVELVRPYCGRSSDNRTHLQFVWIDIGRQQEDSDRWAEFVNLVLKVNDTD